MEQNFKFQFVLVVEKSNLDSFEIAFFNKIKKENLRDNMNNLELALNMLAEATNTEISKEKKPKTFQDNKKIAKQGVTIAGNTKKGIEEKTGKSVVSKLSAKNYLDSKKNLE